jgi:aryl-alcohol dehydrogenase-like predicted oxidoreductase
LRVEAIDLYQIHTVAPEHDGMIEEAWGTLESLRAIGKVRHIGVSNFTVAQMRRAMAIARVETLQPPYSLLERDAEQELLPYCAAERIGVIVYSPMQSGLLTGAMTRERISRLPPTDLRRTEPSFTEPLLTRHLAFVSSLKDTVGRWGLSPGQAAVAWTLANPAVTGAIVGFRRPDQVEAILGNDQLELSGFQKAEIDALIARHAL